MQQIPLCKSEINIKRFKKVKRINNGGFGVVYQVIEKKLEKYLQLKSSTAATMKKNAMK